MKTRCSGALFIIVLFSLVQGLNAQHSKHRWASFRVGSWVELQTVASDGSGKPTNVKFTLREVSSTAAIVHVEMPNGHGMAKDISFPIPEGKHEASRERPDTIVFKGRQLQCRAYEFDDRQVTVWECPEVPGFVAKDKSPRTTTTLVDFEAK